MFCALDDQLEPIGAWEAAPGRSYECASCGCGVHLRAGLHNQAHFAHYASTACIGGSEGEGLEHAQAKVAIFRGMRARGLEAHMEMVVQCRRRERRADVLVIAPNGERIAIEVQNSTISEDEMFARTSDYMNAKPPVRAIWVAVLKTSEFEQATRPIPPLPRSPQNWKVNPRRYVKTTAELIRTGFPARHFEKWAHRYSDHGLWFFELSSEQFWRGYLDVNMRFDEYIKKNENGVPELCGTQVFVATHARNLHLWGPYEACELEIEPWDHPGDSFKTIKIPPGVAARFVAPDELTPEQATRRLNEYTGVGTRMIQHVQGQQPRSIALMRLNENVQDTQPIDEIPEWLPGHLASLPPPFQPREPWVEYERIDDRYERW